MCLLYKWYVNIVVNQMVHEIMGLNGTYNNGHEGTKQLIPINKANDHYR